MRPRTAGFAAPVGFCQRPSCWQQKKMRLPMSNELKLYHSAASPNSRRVRMRRASLSPLNRSISPAASNTPMPPARSIPDASYPHSFWKTALRSVWFRQSGAISKRSIRRRLCWDRRRKTSRSSMDMFHTCSRRPGSVRRNSGRIEFPIVGTRAVVSALGSVNCLTKEGCTHG